jgi:hypothetical protein
MSTCFFCKGVFHPSSGDYFGPQNTPSCGPCTKATIKMIKERTRRRSGGVDFYSHAYTPPAAKYITYRFFTTESTVTSPGRGTYTYIEASGVTVEEAYEKAIDKVPEGCSIWCWMDMTTKTEA